MKTRLIANSSASISSQRTLRTAKSNVDKSMQKLSTGKRINAAGDDAAGLSIASSLQARVKSSSRALRNAGDAVTFVQVAETSLTTIHDTLTRLRELSIQNGSDTMTETQREMNNVEYRQLKSEIERVVYSTKLFNKRLLDGTLGNMKVQVGLHKGANDEIKIDARNFSNTIHALGIFDIDASSRMLAIKSLRKIDYAIEEVARSRAYFGAIHTVLQSASANLDTNIENTTAATSRIMDADVAKQSAELTRNKVVENAAVNVQVQANDRMNLTTHLLNETGRKR